MRYKGGKKGNIFSVRVSQENIFLGKSFLKEEVGVRGGEEQTKYLRLQQRTLPRTAAVMSHPASQPHSPQLGAGKRYRTGSLMRTFGNPGKVNDLQP